MQRNEKFDNQDANLLSMNFQWSPWLTELEHMHSNIPSINPNLAHESKSIKKKKLFGVSH